MYFKDWIDSLFCNTVLFLLVLRLFVESELPNSFWISLLMLCLNSSRCSLNANSSMLGRFPPSFLIFSRRFLNYSVSSDPPKPLLIKSSFLMLSFSPGLLKSSLSWLMDQLASYFSWTATFSLSWIKYLSFLASESTLSLYPIVVKLFRVSFLESGISS